MRSFFVDAGDKQVDVLDEGGNPVEYAVPVAQARREYGRRPIISPERWSRVVLPHERRNA